MIDDTKLEKIYESKEIEQKNLKEEIENLRKQLEIANGF